MCGITAIVGPRAKSYADANARMVDAISHRGPDARDAWSLDGCTLGHARLAIIDLTTGAQPMSDISGRWSIAFNGEIYNYPELRDKLEALGHEFRTHSDTEVLIAGYKEWGAAVVDRLRGMFAFALWDAQERALFVARDLFGEKPLYYATTNDGTLLLASELKAIIASGLIDAQLDRDAVDAYLTLGYVPPDRTIYRNIETLPPAHHLTWRDGKIVVTRYWLPKFDTRTISLHDAADELRRLIRQAVERQMTADVPVGAFLSGGLDSSTVVALMQQHSNIPVKTFSVGFGKYINELPYARAVAERYNTEHHEIDLGEPDVATLIQRMARVYDEPFADTSNIPTYLVSEFARRSVKVVLSGDGGDELFGGYWWYPALAKSEKIAAPLAQWAVLRTFSKLMRHRYRPLTIRSHAAGLAARWSDVWTRDIMTQTVFRKHERARLWGSGEVASFEPGGYYKPSSDTHGLNRAFYFDLTSYLPGDILVKVDRAAMAHGLETRAPLLDRDVVEFALSLPETLKVNGTADTKLVLKEACRQFWPESLWNRPKQGFGAPTAAWLAQPAMRPLLDRVFAANSPLRTLLPGVRGDMKNGSDYRAWSLFTLGLWLDAREVKP
ncbi:MAG: asparagine synthase [Acidobacteria bacterium]|nr:asparagine synthase [Acidobacteriota bacterium]